MKKILFVVFATIIGSSTYASNSYVKLTASGKAVKLKIESKFKRYPVTATCSCGGEVTIYSNCAGTVAECQAGWNAAIEAACGC